jgi:hypothetical protein
MSYIGNSPNQTAFVTDLFNGNGSTTAFTMSVSPANPASILVAVSGVLQSPDTYSVSGQTLNFSAAPPSATGNISVRYLGIPASGVTTTAYRTLTEYTATAGQTTFTPPSYTVGFINVFRNGVMLGTADYTASNGTSVVLTNACTSGDLVVVESFYVSSVLNAIPATANSVIDLYVNQVTGSKLIGSQSIPKATLPTFVSIGLTASITPTSSSSKILVLIDSFVRSDSASYVDATIYRNSTNLGGVYGLKNVYVNDAFVMPVPFAYYDSPATTSSTSYTLYMRTENATTFYLEAAGRISTITLMEIAA